MFRALRLKLLNRVFGGGAVGFLAASLMSWFVDQVRGGLHKDPERLDFATLRPGETYLVTTRPPMGRGEAKAAARRVARAGRLEKMAQPSAKATRVARRLAAAQRKLDRLPADAPKRSRCDARVEGLGTQLSRLMAPSAKELALRDEVARLDAELAAYRAAALKKAPKARRPRVAVFR